MIENATKSDLVEGVIAPSILVTSKGNFKRDYLLNLSKIPKNCNVDPDALAAEWNVSLEVTQKVIVAVREVIRLYEIVYGLPSPQTTTQLTKEQNYFQEHISEKQENVARFLHFQRVCKVSRDFYETIIIIMKYVSAFGENSWVKLLKWKYASFFSYWNDQDIPKKPFEDSYSNLAFFRPEVLLPGIYHQAYTDTTVKKYREKMTGFTDSVLFLKKAMPAVCESMLSEAEFNTAVLLTTPCTDKPKVYEIFTSTGPVVIDRETLEFQLRRSITELFNKVPLKTSDVLKKFVPSVSSNYFNTKFHGGCLGSILNDYGCGPANMPGPVHKDWCELIGDETHESLAFRFPMGLSENSSLIDFGTQQVEFFDPISQHYGSVGRDEDRAFAIEKSRGHEHLTTGTVLCADTRRFDESWKDFYFELFERAKEEQAHVECVALAEPLKVRVISKGPYVLYATLKPIQKWLWKTLRKNTIFKLIGQMVTPEIINSTLGIIKDDIEVVSGDYAAATDNLKSWVSETLLDQLIVELEYSMSVNDLTQLPDNFLVHLKQMMLKALTKHIFTMPEKQGSKKKVQRPQCNGQLMGSIISFPFLCIANAALCRYSMELANGCRYRLTDRPYLNSGKHCPLLINGDDCVFTGVIGRIRPYWENITAIAGLESSVGKTYFSQSFCTINSQIFEFSYETNIWLPRKAINLGLILGLSKSGEANTEPHLMGARCRDLKRTCPDSLWKKVKKMFIHYNFKQLTKYNLSWFLPEWLGGLGLPIDNPDKELSRQDLIVASIIKKNMNRDKKLRPRVVSEAPEWQMHRLVMRDLGKKAPTEDVYFRSFFTENKTYSLERNFSKLYNEVSAQLIFKYDFYQLWEMTDKAASKAMYHNCKVHSHATRLIGTMPVDLIDVSELVHETKKVSMACLIKDIDQITFEGYENHVCPEYELIGTGGYDTEQQLDLLVRPMDGEGPR